MALPTWLCQHGSANLQELLFFFIEKEEEALNFYHTSV
jgi:hypothetical protein